MSALKGLTDGEYGNYYPMYGINTNGLQELLGKISSLKKEDQAKAIKNLFKQRAPNGIGNSRYEMEQKLDQLPADIIEGLLNKRLQLADARHYIVKDISTKNNCDVFVGTDQKAVGLGNIANQKLEKDNWLLLFGIMLRYAVSETGAATADFSHIPPIIRNGEFELEAGNKKLVSLIDNTVFDTRETKAPIGYWAWDNCKIIEPQVEIKMPLKFTAASVANSFLRIGFIGTAVIPY